MDYRNGVDQVELPCDVVYCSTLVNRVNETLAFIKNMGLGDRLSNQQFIKGSAPADVEGKLWHVFAQWYNHEHSIWHG